jgi:Pvc16 N-terminal domain
VAGPGVVRDMSGTLKQLLQTALDGIVAANNVLISTPDSFKTLPRPACTIFLYRVAVNSVMRNGPRVVVRPGVTSRPLLPIDLSYLVTPWGQTPEDEHQILGVVLQALYDNSELGFESLLGDSWLPDDSVQLVLETLPIEEHFCIWDTVGMPYRLSATYRAQIIGIAPAVVESAPPVTRAVFGRPL